MGNAIEDLQNEHEAILAGLKILDTLAGRMDRGLDVQRRDMHDFILFSAGQPVGIAPHPSEPVRSVQFLKEPTDGNSQKFQRLSL